MLKSIYPDVNCPEGRMYALSHLRLDNPGSYAVFQIA